MLCTHLRLPWILDGASRAYFSPVFFTLSLNYDTTTYKHATYDIYLPENSMATMAPLSCPKSHQIKIKTGKILAKNNHQIAGIALF